ncbi:hypothetical protein IGB42_02015 [Andreprevotia sp. IGB-42]|uniref:DUF7931 domain-containing protein n=1 Tax=Andreprevotia sp. IGB-42 TaxID=2497473 RepID=UPI001358073C|nr:hypothetical protein [Andreprevotia sp. IGB-42]KAF0813663.1 hypothetical protein IGB42_02015 [Andreprevotia sp. IGB-42]
MNATTTATFTWPADPPVRFDSYSDYRSGFTSLLATARRSLFLYEHDFRATDLGSRANGELLWTFLSGGGTLTLIARQPEYIASDAPRFLQLNDRFGHQMQLLLLHEDVRADEQMFTLADKQHYLLRHHNDWPRGNAGSDGATVAFLQQKSQYLQEVSESASAWRRLEI